MLDTRIGSLCWDGGGGILLPPSSDLLFIWLMHFVITGIRYHDGCSVYLYDVLA